MPKVASHEGRATDRRSFLCRAAGGLAAALTGPAALAAAPVEPTAPTAPRAPGASAAPAAPPTPVPFELPLGPAGSADESFWEVVKAQFPLRDDLVVMNAANLCPSPFPVSELVEALTRDVDGDASFQNRAKFDELHRRALEALGRYLGAHPDELVITRNTTEGNNTVVTGLELGPGDEVLVWDQNHPTNARAWDVRARREGFEVIRVATPPAPASPDALTRPFLDAFTDRTRVLAFSHLSNVSGVALPARDLCSAARERGVATLIDGAQTLGSLDLDLHELGCDFFTGSAHKWLMGPKEAGVLFVRREWLAEVWPAVVGVGFDPDGPASRRLGTLGQRDDAAVSAMAPAVEFHERIGAARVESRIRDLAGALMDGIRERVPGATFHTPLAPGLRLGVVVFDLPGLADPVAGFRALYREHGVAGAPRGRGGAFPGIRLCPHVYNTMDDVERAVEGVAALV